MVVLTEPVRGEREDTSLLGLTLEVVDDAELKVEEPMLEVEIERVLETERDDVLLTKEVEAVSELVDEMLVDEMRLKELVAQVYCVSVTVVVTAEVLGYLVTVTVMVSVQPGGGP